MFALIVLNFLIPTGAPLWPLSVCFWYAHIKFVKIHIVVDVKVNSEAF